MPSFYNLKVYISLRLIISMKLGYPAINRRIGCTANSTFRLANYSPENLIQKVSDNLKCLRKILEFNAEHSLLFFRLSSDLVPFASHPVCKFNWQKHFKGEFAEIGGFIKAHKLRISMHPDQFVLLNSPNMAIVKKSIEDLRWQCAVLDLMGLDTSAKVQIHIGGVYGDRAAAMKRFVDTYQRLPKSTQRRLVVENDDRLYSLKHCLEISKLTGIPVIFDSFHHELLNCGEQVRDAVKMAAGTWKSPDGLLMTDYSSQEAGKRKGSHAEHIDILHFKRYIKAVRGLEFDIMFEIKDKEKSALEALKVIS
jgi:UV DNA damage endonuclease